MVGLLKLKHWQLFLLMIGIPVIIQIAFAAAFILIRDMRVAYSFFPIVTFFFALILFIWLHTLGTGLHKKLPESVKMNLIKFRVFLLIPVIYIALISIFIFFIFNLTTPTNPTTTLPNIGLFALIIPFHLFSMFCIFYSLYFCAKALKAVEWQKSVTFSDYAGEFFLLWFYPIGIWVIQPRINKLFSNSEVFTPKNI